MFLQSLLSRGCSSWQEHSQAWALPQAAISFKAHLPAVVWWSHMWQCGNLLLCGPWWARRGQTVSQWSSWGSSQGSLVDTASPSFSDLSACKGFFSHFFLTTVSDASLHIFIHFVNTLQLPWPWAQPHPTCGGRLDLVGTISVWLGQPRPPLTECPLPPCSPLQAKPCQIHLF